MAANLIESDALISTSYSQQYFSDEIFDTSIERTLYQEYYPISGLTDSSESFTFILPKFVGPNSYDLSKCQLMADIALLDKDNGWLADGEEISTCDNILFSCFR